MAVVSSTPDLDFMVDHISLRDVLSFGLAIIFQFPPILISCFIRRWRIDNDLNLRTDLFRSSLRTLRLRVPNSIMQNFLAANIPEMILTSNRFRNSSHRLCERICHKEFAGYWICKGPPNRTQTPIESRKILLHIHGGGYVAGHPLGSLAQLLRVAELAAGDDVTVGIFALHYSLGPQAKFPQQVEEAIAAYRYLLDELHIAPGDIILEGDSAGGHLALSLLQELANHALPRPGGCILVYPWANLSNSGDSFRRNCFRDVLTKAGLDHAADQVLGPDGRSKFAHLFNFSAPLVGARTWKEILPLTWVSTGVDDCLLDDIVAFVENARLDGADVDFQLVAGKAHAWLTFDDSRDIRTYCNLEPPTSMGKKMAGARHIYQGLSAILDNSRCRKGSRGDTGSRMARSIEDSQI